MQQKLQRLWGGSGDFFPFDRGANNNNNNSNNLCRSSWPSRTCFTYFRAAGGRKDVEKVCARRKREREKQKKNRDFLRRESEKCAIFINFVFIFLSPLLFFIYSRGRIKKRGRAKTRRVDETVRIITRTIFLQNAYYVRARFRTNSYGINIYNIRFLRLSLSLRFALFRRHARFRRPRVSHVIENGYRLSFTRTVFLSRTFQPCPPNPPLVQVLPFYYFLRHEVISGPFRAPYTRRHFHTRSHRTHFLHVVFVWVFRFLFFSRPFYFLSPRLVRLTNDGRP